MVDRLAKCRVSFGGAGLFYSGLLAVSLSACGPEPPPTTPAPATATPSASVPVALPPAPDPFPVPPGEPRHKRVLSKRLQLSIPLPDRGGWQLRRDKGSFLVLEHAATASTLQISLWREGDNMNRQRCEQRARLIRDLPRRGRHLESAHVAVPAGFDTRVDVGFVATAGPTAADAPIDGYLLAFGGNVHRCFALTYTSRASGVDAEQVIGERLAVMQSLTLEGLELRSDIAIGR